MVCWRGVTAVQCWRWFEDLERFSRSTDGPHWSGWRRFSRGVGYKDGSVGIWHGTYVVEPGHYEAIYGNMPLFGLAAATRQVPAGGRRETARRRLEPGEEADARATNAAPPSVGAELPSAREAR